MQHNSADNAGMTKTFDLKKYFRQCRFDSNTTIQAMPNCFIKTLQFRKYRFDLKINNADNAGWS